MIEILDKISQNFFVFWPCRTSYYKPPSAKEADLETGMSALVSVSATTLSYF
jgi:hypothetical protein